MGPGAADPAEELADGAEDEDEQPPAAGEDELDGVGEGDEGEEEDEDDAGGEGGRVAVVGRIAGVEGRAGWRPVVFFARHGNCNCFEF